MAKKDTNDVESVEDIDTQKTSLSGHTVADLMASERFATRRYLLALLDPDKCYSVEVAEKELKNLENKEVR